MRRLRTSAERAAENGTEHLVVRTGADPRPLRGEDRPVGFIAAIDNRYFPLKPGTGFHYRGVAENGRTPQADDMVVTHRTPAERCTCPPARTGRRCSPSRPARGFDPGVVERKEYVAGVGDVREQTVRGDRERIALVSVTR
jgi:hypothetical protein